MHKEIAQARSTEHDLAAQTSWFGACSFLVAVIVLIGFIILIGARLRRCSVELKVGGGRRSDAHSYRVQRGPRLSTASLEM